MARTDDSHVGGSAHLVPHDARFDSWDARFIVPGDRLLPTEALPTHMLGSCIRRKPAALDLQHQILKVVGTHSGNS